MEIKVIEKRHLLRVVSKSQRSDGYATVQLKHAVGGVLGSVLVNCEIAKKLKTGQLVDVEEDEGGELHLVDATPTKRQKTAAQPLRRVLGLVEVKKRRILSASARTVSLVCELYECGHVRAPKKDMIGRTNAERRRCYQCADGKPAEARWKQEAEKRLKEEGPQ